MFQVRVHGRGGQGVVTTAELLSVAAFRDGRYAQAFPTFGSERTGAPVVGFCRIDDQPIRTQEPVAARTRVIIQDATLLHQVDVFDGLDAGWLPAGQPSTRFDELGLHAIVARLGPERAITVPATELAMTHLRRPLPGAVLLGAFAALTGSGAPRVGRRGDPGTIPGPGRRRQHRRGRRGVRAGPSTVRGAGSCSNRLKVRAASRRRSRFAAPR